MPPIFRGQIDAVGLVVRGENYSNPVEDAVLAKVLLVDAQHVRRGGGVGLHVIVKLISVDVP